VPPRQAI